MINAKSINKKLEPYFKKYNCETSKELHERHCTNGIGFSAFRARLYTGKSPDYALHHPVVGNNMNKRAPSDHVRKILREYQVDTIVELHEKYIKDHIPLKTLRTRLQARMTMQEIMNKPLKNLPKTQSRTREGWLELAKNAPRVGVFQL